MSERNKLLKCLLGNYPAVCAHVRQKSSSEQRDRKRQGDVVFKVDVTVKVKKKKKPQHTLSTNLPLSPWCAPIWQHLQSSV